jgi:hypothetical protein
VAYVSAEVALQMKLIGYEIISLQVLIPSLSLFFY